MGDIVADRGQIYETLLRSESLHPDPLQGAAGKRLAQAAPFRDGGRPKGPVHRVLMDRAVPDRPCRCARLTG